MRKTIALQTETRAYDAFQRLTSMTQFDGTAITYNYAQTANDGKIVSQTTGSETVNYTYDSLGRLTQAATAGAGGWGLAWMYDGWGNRLQQSAVKGTVPTMVSTTDPATNRIQAHTYDANGNTTYTPQQGTMTYDVFNRLKTVAADTYGYDPANKRLWKNDDFTFWGASGERIGRYSAVKLIENQNGTLVHTFVFQKVQTDEYFGGRRLTTQDRLGSVGSYYPYGEAKSGTVSNADSFATYYRDSTGLDYADQRHYAASFGRFTSADPYQASAGPADPASWNRYSYVRADPINRSDPSGLQDQTPTFTVTGYCVGCVGTFGGAGGGGGPYEAGGHLMWDQSLGDYGLWNMGATLSTASIEQEALEFAAMLERAAECIGQAVANHYGLTAAAAGVTALLGPIPKSIVPPFRSIGSSTTTFLSVMGHYFSSSVGRIMTGSLGTPNVLRAAGRIIAPVAGPIGWALLAVDIAMITSESVGCFQQTPQAQPGNP